MKIHNGHNGNNGRNGHNCCIQIGRGDKSRTNVDHSTSKNSCGITRGIPKINFDASKQKMID